MQSNRRGVPAGGRQGPLSPFSVKPLPGSFAQRDTEVSARIPNPVCGHRSDAANAFEIFQFRTGVFRTGHFLSRQFRRDQMNLAGRLKQFNQPRQGGPGRVSRWDGRPIRNATTLQKNGRKAEMRGRRPQTSRGASNVRLPEFVGPVRRQLAVHFIGGARSESIRINRDGLLVAPDTFDPHAAHLPPRRARESFHDKWLMSKWIDGNRREREHATEQFSCVADQSLRHEARILPTQNSDRGNDRVVRRAVPNQVP